LPRIGRNGSAVTEEPDVIAATLCDVDLQIFEDHAGCECGHLVVREAEDYCYVVFSRKKRRVVGIDLPYCHLHYISNRRVFVRQLDRIKWYFLRRQGATFLAVDERLLGGRVGVLRKSHVLSTPRYYRSDTLAADQVDNLYTELVLGL
jgi:hypothetical protein